MDCLNFAGPRPHFILQFATDSETFLELLMAMPDSPNSLAITSRTTAAAATKSEPAEIAVAVATAGL